MKNKKLILILVGIIVIGLIVLMVIILKDNDTEGGEIKTPDFLLETSIQQKDDLIISKMEDIPRLSPSSSIYYVEDITNVSAVEKFINNLGFDYKRNKAVVENHFSWGDEDSTAYFNYFTETNVLSINIRQSVKAVIPLTRDNAEEIVNRYLNGAGLDYEYKMLKIESLENSTNVYLSRMLGEYSIEMNNQYGATDSLIFSERGELIYAELLFAKFTNKMDYKIPLIDTRDLLTVINDAKYPKEIRVDDVNFLDEEVVELKEPSQIEGEYGDTASMVIGTVQDCNPTEISLIYYYSGTRGGYILPTYKLTCISKATYEGIEYFIPSVVYTNAISPEYISAE